MTLVFVYQYLPLGEEILPFLMVVSFGAAPVSHMFSLDPGVQTSDADPDGLQRSRAIVGRRGISTDPLQCQEHLQTPGASAEELSSHGFGG